MDKKTTAYKELREWFEFTKDNVKSMITQIISSKEFTASLNKIPQKLKKKYLKDIDLIAEKVIDKEIEYYIDHYKVNSAEEYAKIIEKISPNDIYRIKSKCCNEVLEEMSSKNGS